MSQTPLSLFFPPLTPDSVSDGSLHYYHRPIIELNVPGILPFYALHLAIWQLRPLDLQKLFPLETIAGRIGFLNWCVIHGRREYAALRELDEFWAALAESADIQESRFSVAINRLILLAITARLGFEYKDKLNHEQQQLVVIQWLCQQGWKELNLQAEDITAAQKQLFESKLSNGFSFVATMIHASQTELQSQFNLDTETGQNDYRNWLIQHGNQETIISLLQANTTPPKISNSQQEQVFGVNLIGYAYGELGIGEDVRMAALALEAANIPFTIINFPPGSDIRQDDRSVEEWVSNTPIYAINIVCLTALEHLRLYAEHGSSLFNNRYTIGYWPWELQKWPDNWQHCFSLVAEVWSSSKHTWQALNAVSPVPVLTMPMAVVLRDVKRYTRKQWSLPASHFLFVFSFDGNSSLARKNPQAIISAFKLAFPNGNETVGLVIKCMRPDENNPAWQTILKWADQDQRIHIIDKTLEKPEVLGLYKLCNCFISLHRAEGFGRGIAEAMLLGLDVIATDHGGNVDFCLPDKVFLVPSKLIDVGTDDYIEPFKQQWAEPDIQHAANIMLNVSTRSLKPGKKFLKEMQNIFDPGAIGERYHSRLQQLWLSKFHTSSA